LKWRNNLGFALKGDIAFYLRFSAGDNARSIAFFFKKLHELHENRIEI